MQPKMQHHQHRCMLPLTAHDVEHLLCFVGFTGSLDAHQTRVVEGVVEAAAALNPVVVVEDACVQSTATNTQNDTSINNKALVETHWTYPRMRRQRQTQKSQHFPGSSRPCHPFTLARALVHLGNEDTWLSPGDAWLLPTRKESRWKNRIRKRKHESCKMQSSCSNPSMPSSTHLCMPLPGPPLLKLLPPPNR